MTTYFYLYLFRVENLRVLCKVTEAEKSIHIRSFSVPYFRALGLNTEK